MGYCRGASSAGPTSSGNLAVLVPTSGNVKLISFRSYGENTTTAKVEVPLNHPFPNGFVTTTLTSTFTPEETNTRSAANVETYGLTASNGTFASLVFFAGPFFTHYGFVFSGRYQPVIGPNTAGGGLTNDNCFNLAGLTTVNACVLEADIYPSRRLARKSRKGYFPRLGNELHQHQVTGGGAFSQLCPHFDNDIVYTDINAWRLGWINPGLVSVDSRRQRTLVGVGQ